MIDLKDRVAVVTGADARVTPSAEELVDRWEGVVDRRGEMTPAYGFAQSELELKKAGFLSPERKGA